MERYKHPIARDIEEKARRVGGHGGMDFIMDYRLVYCLQHGLPLDQDVYDAAEWSCIGSLTAASLEHNSMPVAVPDFTRGDWDKVDGSAMPWRSKNRFDIPKSRTFRPAFSFVAAPLQSVS